MERKSVGTCGHALETPLGTLMSFEGEDFMGVITRVLTVCNKCLDWYVKEMNVEVIEPQSVKIPSSNLSDDV